MNEVSTSNAADAKPAVEKTNISVAELASRRVGELVKRNAPKEQPKPAVETAPTPKAEEPKPVSQESPAEVPKPEEDSKDVLSQVDLSKLTDEQITELAARGKSGLLKRVAELTALRKMAEEKAQSLEEFVSKKQAESPLQEKVNDNPYAKIETTSELTAKYEEVSAVIEWAEEVLDKSENLGSDDLAAVVDGQNLTKAQVKETLRKARKAKDKYLPAQFKQLQGKEVRTLQRKAFDAQARQELPWMAEEDNELKKTFQAMVTDPRLKKLEETVPELAPQMGYILAHAANSIHNRRSLSLEPEKKVVKVNPPENPSSSAAASSRSESRGEKNVSELQKRYRETGKMEDLVALRTAQSTTKRKNLA